MYRSRSIVEVAEWWLMVTHYMLHKARGPSGKVQKSGGLRLHKAMLQQLD